MISSTINNQNPFPPHGFPLTTNHPRLHLPAAPLPYPPPSKNKKTKSPLCLACFIHLQTDPLPRLLRAQEPPPPRPPPRHILPTSRCNGVSSGTGLLESKTLKRRGKAEFGGRGKMLIWGMRMGVFDASLFSPRKGPLTSVISWPWIGERTRIMKFQELFPEPGLMD